MKPRTTSVDLRLVLKYVLFASLSLALLWYAGMVLKPVRIGGAAWGDFAVLEPESVDVIVFGNSHAFAGVDPASIWAEAGIPAFVHAGPMQRLSVTAHYVHEAMRTQSPKVVAVELSSAAYREDDYNQRFQLINVGYMPWSPDKLGAALDATPPQDRTGALLDPWTYHTRWSELERSDWNIVGKHRELSFLRGFQPKMGTSSVPSSSTVAPRDEATANEMLAYNDEALRSIAETCEQNDATLLLFVTPTGPPGVYTGLLERAYEQLSAEFDNVAMLDLSESGVVDGLSYDSDFFDEGHLNSSGSAKSSAALARYLARELQLPDRAADPSYAASERDAERTRTYVRELHQ